MSNSKRQQDTDSFIELALEDGPSANVAAQDLDLWQRDIAGCCVAGGLKGLQNLLGKWPVSDYVSQPTGPRNWSPLLYACFSRINEIPEEHSHFAELAQFLLEHGADPDSHYFSEPYPTCPQSALYGAVGVNNNPLLADVLLRHGANTQDGESIYHAAQHGHIECLEVLARHGADFSAAQQPWGNTPLYFLLGHRPTDEQWPTALTGIRWLLSEGKADPNVSSGEYEEVPLHLAARRHGAEVVELLLEHDAHADSPTRDGLTPFAVAARYGNLAALDTLRKHGGEMPLSTTDRLLAAIAVGDELHASAVMQGEPSLATRLCARDFGALIEHAGNDNTRAVAAWCAVGLPLDSQADCQSTALHQACWYAYMASARILIEHGAPLDIKDDMYGGTPLDWVCHGSLYCRAQPGGTYAQLAQLLIDAGAPLPKQDWGSVEVQAVLRKARG